MAVSRPARRRTQIDFAEYRTQLKEVEGEALVQKIAHFLDWASETKPKEVIPYNQITRSVYDLKQMPRLMNNEVVLVQRSMSRVRAVLINKYKRSLVSVPGIGCRATVDDADIVTTELAKNVRRIEKDSQRVAQIYSLVDPAKLPSTEEFKPWKDWFHRQSGTGGLFKMIQSSDWSKRLALPPAPEAEKK